MGDELLRFFDRNEASLVLGMTHEEAAVELVREYGGSYAKYPSSFIRSKPNSEMNAGREAD